MFWRVVRNALVRQHGRRVMIAVTIALGVSLATAMLNLMLDVGDKVNQELKAYGANITVRPKGTAVVSELFEGTDSGTSAHLRESELGNIKTIFWALNIVDFAPYLEHEATLDGDREVTLVGTWFDKDLKLPTGEQVQTGIANMKSWWDVRGEWATDAGKGVMVGTTAAAEAGLDIGDPVELSSGRREANLVVTGIIDSGGPEDSQFFAPLGTVQALTDNSGNVGRVEVSALTTPDNDLSRRAAKNPDSLSISDWETWYCTAYASSISYQIEEVLTDSVAKPIRQVADSEGAILEKTQLLMLVITALALVGAALGISNLVTASVMERAPEIGLMEALGARDASVVLLFLTEVFVVGIVGGIAGYFAGLGFAQLIGQTVFGSAIAIKPIIVPVLAVLVALVILIGSLPAMRLLLSLRPAEVLHGR